jgi:Xaa-Pro dipeptidase
LRRVKSKLEMEQMDNAGRANDEGMRAGLAVTRLGSKRKTLHPRSWVPRSRPAANMSAWSRSSPRVPRSGIPHTTWRRRKLVSGDVCRARDLPCYNRYHVALFRTVAIGKIPQLASDMYKVCAEG